MKAFYGEILLNLKEHVMKLIGLLLLFSFTIDASELIVNTSSGNDYYLEIEPEDSFEEVFSTLQSLESDTKGIICFNLFGTKFVAKTKSANTSPRNYYKPLTQKEEETVHELLTTLAYQNLIKIGTKRSSLTKTGDQIENLHPLKFLQYVFSNDELIVAIRNIKNRMIWSEFIGPILESLQKEASIGNITSDQIHDLAMRIKLDVNLIQGPINAQNWNALVDTLIVQVRRSNDAKRYDM